MIELKHVTKRYGAKCAVNDISFTINKGEVLGFLGRNGAGKSTTMNMITGYISASEGQILIDGMDILEQPREAKRRIGYLPELPPLYMDMTVEEYLKFVCEIKEVRRKSQKAHLDDLYNLVKITDVRHRLIRNLSKGYKQRVGFAQALLGDPPVLILDEPTVGLDPTQLMEVRNIILDLRHNHAIILSSHILGEISAVCDRIVVINHGEIKADDTIEHLEESMESGTILRLKVQGSSREVSKVARGVEGVVRVGNIQFVKTGVYTYDVEIQDESIRNALLSALLQRGLEVLEVSAEKKNLEQVFVKLVNQPEKRTSLKDLLDEMAEEDAAETNGAEEETPSETDSEDSAESETKED